MAGVSRGRQLVTSGRVVATGAYTILTGTLADVPGATLTFTAPSAGFAIVTIVADLEGSAGNTAFCKLVVDGTAQTEAALLFGVGRETVSQTYRVSLTAASHTLKLQANQSGGYNTVYSPQTTLTYTFIPS